jgi:hypothetical protein
MERELDVTAEAEVWALPEVVEWCDEEGEVESCHR